MIFVKKKLDLGELWTSIVLLVSFELDPSTIYQSYPDEIGIAPVE